MSLRPPIFLAYGESSVWDAIIWLVAGIVWLFLQIGNARKKQEKKNQQAQPPQPPAAASGGGESPTPHELADIFKRLGAEIPNTPPPVPRAAPPPAAPARTAAAPQMPRKSARIPAKSGAILPALAQRLAKAKQEAAEAARLAEAERIPIQAIAHGIQSREGETRALETAMRHTGAILPRLYAMSLRLAPLPTLPMPGLDRTHHVIKPMRTKLHSRREVRDALMVQTFLQPAKGVAR